MYQSASLQTELPKSALKEVQPHAETEARMPGVDPNDSVHNRIPRGEMESYSSRQKRSGSGSEDLEPPSRADRDSENNSASRLTCNIDEC